MRYANEVTLAVSDEQMGNVQTGHRRYDTAALCSELRARGDGAVVGTMSCRSVPLRVPGTNMTFLGTGTTWRLSGYRRFGW